MRLLSKVEFAIGGFNILTGILSLLANSPILGLGNFALASAMLCLAWSERKP